MGQSLIKRFLTTTSLVAALPLGLAACANLVPKDGPTGVEVRRGAEVQLSDSANVSYAIVKLTPTIARHVHRAVTAPVLFQSAVRGSGLPDVRVGAGDTVTVTIFEAQAGGLFIPGQPGTSTGNFVQLPAQQIDRSGNISVPYAGAIAAVGRTPAEIQSEIESKLRSRAIEPQVVVTVNQRQSDEVSVLGEVNTPARFALEPGGTKLLNAIARAGGAKNPGYETIITLQRRGRVDQALLTSIVANPSYNINLAPGDVVYASREQRFYLVFGATPAPGAVGGQQNRRFPFETENLTLAEAVAKAGGLDESPRRSAIRLPVPPRAAPVPGRHRRRRLALQGAGDPDRLHGRSQRHAGLFPGELVLHAPQGRGLRVQLAERGSREAHGDRPLGHRHRERRPPRERPAPSTELRAGAGATARLSHI